MKNLDRAGVRLEKVKEIKQDGRYIIFYSSPSSQTTVGTEQREDKSQRDGDGGSDV